jgi:hypothetical protein
MPSRRSFLQALTAAPLLLGARSTVAASARTTQAALVIGNAAYRHSPLLNPTNDARAMGGLLEQAGFGVDLRLDANRGTMVEAIERFGRTVQSPDTRLAVLYYAGHGAQLDWRNYLLPVDAAAHSAATLKAACIDLGMVLDHFIRAQKQGQDKTFVVVLDACRDNPFGTAFRPLHKGLSQFDAPVGSLLAYATAPGNVASDGSGENGLYTENLVRELAVRGARVEDALKRVRLNVRLASRGEQVPWESTSLESDLILFPDATRSLSAEEIERRFTAELADWNRIKASRQTADWIAYLKAYPNGRFAEIAQARLDHLLASTERHAVPATPAPTPVPDTDADSENEIGTALPQEVATATVSHNPYSAGRYPLGRKFTVGDTAVLRDSDLLTGITEGRHRLRVTRVDLDADRIEINGGKMVLDGMGNTLETPNYVADVPQQFVPVELQVGKRWKARFSLSFKGARGAGQSADTDMDVRIDTRETVRVPAGEFDAFKIEAHGWSSDRKGAQVEISLRFWVVPGVNFAVRAERIKKRGNRLIETRLTELMAIHQAATGLSG